MGWAMLRGLGLCQFLALECCRFRKIAIFFHALVALKRLVSLLGRLVACSARIVVDTQTNYCNPHCACAPRVNEKEHSPIARGSQSSCRSSQLSPCPGGSPLLTTKPDWHCSVDILSRLSYVYTWSRLTG